MPNAAGEPAKPPRTWRPMAAWSAAIIAFLGVTFAAAKVFPAYRSVNQALQGLQDRHVRDEATAIGLLDGPDAASSAITIYLHIPGREPTKCKLAIEVLGECGSPAVPELLRLLHDSDPEMRLAAAGAIARCGPEAKGACGALRAALTDGHAPVRAMAAAALTNIGVEDDATADLLEAAADKDLDVEVREAAVFALNSYEPRAERTIPALRVMLAPRSKWSSSRWRAACALGALGPKAAAATSDLLPILDEEPHDFQLRTYVVTALWKIERDARKTVPLLMNLVKTATEDDSETWYAAVKGLGSFGPEARDALPLLRLALKDPEPTKRVFAAEAVGLIAPGDTDALAVLDEVMQDWNMNWQIRAAESLAVLNPRSEKALAFLRKSLGDSRATWTAAHSLGKMGGFAAPAVPELIATLESERSDDRVAAADGLGGIGPAASKAEAALQEHLKDCDSRVRQAAAEALKKIRGSEPVK
jgi:HEAT repeat protein